MTWRLGDTFVTEINPGRKRATFFFMGYSYIGVSGYQQE